MSTKLGRTVKQAVRKFTYLNSVTAIRRSLVSLIPMLLVGAFALAINYFPIDAYQEFLSDFAGGFISELLTLIYEATFGLLSLYMCINLGYHYATAKADRFTGASIGCPLVSVACFVILTGIDSLSVDTLGAKGMFIAIIASLGASFLLCALVPLFKTKKLLTEGADANLDNALRLIIPMALTVVAFAITNSIILLIFKGDNAHKLLLNLANYLFSLIGNKFLSGLLFVIISSILWFFGIHGSDVLDGVADTLFVPNIDINISLVEQGLAPTEILTKQFFDVFVLMGGCGSAICLLLALLIFSKRKTNRSLAKMAAFPMIFNINEIMVFGLPIIYNPIMLIPFLCVPIVCFLTSYVAMATGIVPMVTSAIEWTTPVILGGYMATGSVMGSVLQIVNIALGVLIYFPFVRHYDNERLENFKEDYERLVEIQKQKEKNREDFSLIELHGSNGAFAKSLAAEIGYQIESGDFNIYYQPQYRLDGELYGAEALLRFELPNIGFVYPPLIIELAQETGKLQLLEKNIFKKVKADSEALWSMNKKTLKISINISGQSIQSKSFEDFLIELSSSYSAENPLCIEITEQTALIFNDELKERIGRLKAAGYMFAIDDFSAGNTSFQYLQENFFDIVKLDGSIVQNCITNERCNELTTRIIDLSHSLGFKVIAEFVSSEEIRDCMARAGCTIYQGWYYSPAVKFDELKEKLRLSYGD